MQKDDIDLTKKYNYSFNGSYYQFYGIYYLMATITDFTSFDLFLNFNNLLYIYNYFKQFFLFELIVIQNILETFTQDL